MQYVPKDMDEKHLQRDMEEYKKEEAHMKEKLDRLEQEVRAR